MSLRNIAWVRAADADAGRVPREAADEERGLRDGREAQLRGPVRVFMARGQGRELDDERPPAPVQDAILVPHHSGHVSQQNAIDREFLWLTIAF